MLRSLIVCVTLIFVTDIVVCKPDYLFNLQVNGWLKLHAAPATWQEAFLNCHHEGAVLASPLNAKLATALRSIMSQSNLDYSIFLGVQALSQGDFFSIEGVPLADLSITWGTYADDEKPKDCLSLSTNGRTYLSSCELSLPYICYKKRDNTTSLNECGTFDDDYQLHRATGSCYKHHKKASTWTTAHRTCTAEGAHLLIINDQREADIIAKDYLDPPSSNKLLGEATHIGLRDWNGHQTWLSIHGEKIEDLFNTWDSSEKYYSCGLFWAQGTLDDVACDNDHAAYTICEKNPFTSRFENISGTDNEASLNSHDVVVYKPDYLFNYEVNGWLKLHALTATWQEAFLNCHYEGAVLASPINAKFATTLRSIMSQSNLDNSIFLGAKAFSPGDFFSIEGALADFSITWGTYGDGGKPKDCLSLSTDGKAYFSSCELSLPYICYKKRDNTTSLNECGSFDDDYQLHRATGSCYKHHKKTSTWTTAHKTCTAEGAHLLIINDQREADIIAKDYLDPPTGYKLLGEATHIGLRHWPNSPSLWYSDHNWLSIHGEKIEDLFNTWDEGKPNYRNERNLCGLFWGQGTLDHDQCDQLKYSFICEKNPNTSRFENIFG